MQDSLESKELDDLFGGFSQVPGAFAFQAFGGHCQLVLQINSRGLTGRLLDNLHHFGHQLPVVGW